MQKPDAPVRLERARKQVTELREMVNSYCEAVPVQLRIPDDDFRVASLDAQVQAVNAPAASLESDLFALEARVRDLQRA